MKDEIKEILDIFTKYKDDWYSVEYTLKPKQCVILYDYITNLQTIEQQYSAILSENVELENKITNLQEELEEQKRIEQASLDTINNLQEENERLKEIEKEHKNCTRKHWQQKCAEHCANEMIYKSRIDKAVEYIKECIDSEDIYEQFLSTGETKEILNILNGGKNE